MLGMLSGKKGRACSSEQAGVAVARAHCVQGMLAALSRLRYGVVAQLS